jgi:hypothetical protein
LDVVGDERELDYSVIRRLAGWLGLGLLCCSVEADTVTNVLHLTRTTVTTNAGAVTPMTNNTTGVLSPAATGTYTNCGIWSDSTYKSNWYYSATAGCSIYFCNFGYWTMHSGIPGDFVFGSWDSSSLLGVYSNVGEGYSGIATVEIAAASGYVTNYTYTTNIVSGYTSTVSVVEGMAIRSYSFSP